jgi:hypothetical protein
MRSLTGIRIQIQNHHLPSCSIRHEVPTWIRDARPFEWLTRRADIFDCTDEVFKEEVFDVGCIIWVRVCGNGWSGGSFLIEVAGEQARRKISWGSGKRTGGASLLLGYINRKDRIFKEDVSPGYTE